MLLYILVAAAVLLIFALALLSPDNAPRCDCGRRASYLLSDRSWECDACRTARLSGRPPRPKR
jgi:hypothetical protein